MGLFKLLFYFPCVFGVFPVERPLSANLLEGLRLGEVYPGVDEAPGPNNQSKAFLFQDSWRKVRVRGPVAERITAKLRQRSEFTLLVTLKQERLNSGVLLSIHDTERKFLEVESSGQQSELRVHYWSRELGPRTEVFPYSLADGRWHKLSLAVAGARMALHVDCNRIYERAIEPLWMDLTNETTVWLGQRNKAHGYFKGIMQDVILLASNQGYVVQCPDLNRTCPTCNDFHGLVQKIMELQDVLARTSNKLARAEEKMRGLDGCSCNRTGLSEEGGVYRDQDRWVDGCRNCSCLNATVRCEPLSCPRLQCPPHSAAAYVPGACCKECQPVCLFRGRMYVQGERRSVRNSTGNCLLFQCQGGAMGKAGDWSCPTLSCPEAEQISLTDRCCKVCRECVNLEAGAYCSCRDGYRATRDDSAYCQDGCSVLTDGCSVLTDGCSVLTDGCSVLTDGCSVLTDGCSVLTDGCSVLTGGCSVLTDGCSVLTDGCSVLTDGCSVLTDGCSVLTDGCSVLTDGCSVLTDGCSVLTGRLQGCSVLTDGCSVLTDGCSVLTDGCSVLTDGCSVLTDGCSVLTDGCSVLTDGCSVLTGGCAQAPRASVNRMEPKITTQRNPGSMCDGLCQNGGSCMSPDLCVCPQGYTGKRCETDIDECSDGFVQCDSRANCINLPGWYHCECRDGYHDNGLFASNGESCEDMTCVNVAGGYACHCPRGRSCSGDCRFDSQVKHHGHIWVMDSDRCSVCSCQTSRVMCRRMVCDCDNPTVDVFCCPECDPRLSGRCLDQNSRLSYNSGDTWLEGCQQCQCTRGEVDCWPVTCAALGDCELSGVPEGECCPRCVSDPCLADGVTPDNHLEGTCTDEGGLTRFGGATWTKHGAECVLCQCK
ncbi:hypothetical protein NHX12_020835, partial [Muraenolepis orangiensis]